MSLVRHVPPGVETLICKEDTGREATPRGALRFKWWLQALACSSPAWITCSGLAKTERPVYTQEEQNRRGVITIKKFFNRWTAAAKVSKVGAIVGAATGRTHFRCRLCAVPGRAKGKDFGDGSDGVSSRTDIEALSNSTGLGIAVRVQLTSIKDCWKTSSRAHYRSLTAET